MISGTRSQSILNVSTSKNKKPKSIKLPKRMNQRHSSIKYSLGIDMFHLTHFGVIELIYKHET